MLTGVTGRVDCFGLCAPARLKDKVLCVLQYIYLYLCYFTGIFYAAVRQISMLFIENKHPVFGIL